MGTIYSFEKKSAQHRKLHPVLETRYAEFTGDYRLSKNRTQKRKSKSVGT